MYLDKRLLPEIPWFFLWSAKRGSSHLHLTGIKWGRGKKSLSTTSEQDDTYPWVANPFQFVGCLWATVPTVSSNCWSFPSSLSGRWCTCLGGISESSEAGMRYLFTTSIFPCGVFLVRGACTEILTVFSVHCSAKCGWLVMSVRDPIVWGGVWQEFCWCAVYTTLVLCFEHCLCLKDWWLVLYVCWVLPGDGNGQWDGEVPMVSRHWTSLQATFIWECAPIFEGELLLSCQTDTDHLVSVCSVLYSLPNMRNIGCQHHLCLMCSSVEGWLLW